MQAQEMSEDRKALAIMAHDIKAPISAIKDILDVINKGYVQDEVKVMELVSRASQKAETVIVMLDDILDYTLLANKAMMKREKINLFDAIKEAVSIMKPYVDKRNLTLSCDCDLSGEKYVYGNYTFLLRVFDNIIMNAIKYNKENGKISIDCSEDTEKNTITVEVKDTGIGIPENEQKKVFKFFERGIYARKNVDGSIGLGLSLVKQIIEDHNGKIDLTSTVGVGTSIYLTLPLIKEGGTNEL
jgi:two-component system phosphate regulon sensor histidine kinase PhoR